MRRQFEEQLRGIMERLTETSERNRDLEEVYRRLVSLRISNAHHASLELVVANHFLSRGYRVWVEHEKDGLILDVYSLGDREVGVEVETAFIPPEVLDSPEDYLTARLTVKVARYGKSVQDFYIAVPSYVFPPLPAVFLKAPEERDEEELRCLFRLVRRFHNIPGLDLRSLKEGRLSGLLSVNLSSLSVSSLDVAVLSGNSEVDCP